MTDAHLPISRRGVLYRRSDEQPPPAAGTLYRVAGTPRSRTTLAAALTFVGAAIGLATLWGALATRQWEELEAVLVPLLILGVALAVGWACVLGVGLLAQWTWARQWALLTFIVVSAWSGLAVADAAGLVSGGDSPVRDLAAPASLFAVAAAIVLLLGFDRQPGGS